MSGEHIASCDGSWCDGACVQLERVRVMAQQILLALKGGHDPRCRCYLMRCDNKCEGDCTWCDCEFIAEIRAEERVDCDCEY